MSPTPPPSSSSSSADAPAKQSTAAKPSVDLNGLPDPHAEPEELKSSRRRIPSFFQNRKRHAPDSPSSKSSTSNPLLLASPPSSLAPSPVKKQPRPPTPTRFPLAKLALTSPFQKFRLADLEEEKEGKMAMDSLAGVKPTAKRQAEEMAKQEGKDKRSKMER